VTKQVHRYWFAHPKVGKPYQENAVGDEGRLFPRDCREGVSTCTASPPVFMRVMDQLAAASLLILCLWSPPPATYRGALTPALHM
jgi:hypothetical protein